LPFRFGEGYGLEFRPTKNESEFYDLLLKKKNFELINEIRIKDLQLDPLTKDEMQELQGNQVQPDGTNQNPLFTKGVE
jgi:hypothetical protein